MAKGVSEIWKEKRQALLASFSIELGQLIGFLFRAYALSRGVVRYAQPLSRDTVPPS